MSRVSIVVPALDEADRIAATLDPLVPLRTRGHEIIVVDGGSRDATLERAAPLADRVFVARRGRAAQMNAGANIAAGDILLFLHADTRIEPSAVANLGTSLDRAGRQWGRFDVAIEGRSPLLRIVAATMNLRSRVTGIATGDQAIFVARQLFDAVGGFPEQPLMEDVELSRRLKRAGGRPWERGGVWRTVAAMWRTRFAYWRGADPAALAARYTNVRQGYPQREVGARDANPRVATPGSGPVTRPAAPPVLLVFAKAPIAGAVKTRLVPTIGEQAAAAVHEELVERTLTTAIAARRAGVVVDVEMWCAPDAAHPAFLRWRERYGVALRTQSGADLGARMRHALDAALRAGRAAILVGCDCPVLDVDTLAQAVRALADHDAVVAPAEDGGYVLIGLARTVDAFSGIEWGKPGVMAATRARLAALRATWRELPLLWDVDEARDLSRWRALAQQATAAGATVG
jgi:rSAM/selenodomain-associated transferase 2/rSAM/selenodomain-associated transferase 1